MSCSDSHIQFCNQSCQKHFESSLFSPSSVIGTSSLRRAAQLKKRFPQLEFENIVSCIVFLSLCVCGCVFIINRSRFTIDFDRLLKQADISWVFLTPVSFLCIVLYHFYVIRVFFLDITTLEREPEHTFKEAGWKGWLCCHYSGCCRPQTYGLGKQNQSGWLKSQWSWSFLIRFYCTVL